MVRLMWENVCCGRIDGVELMVGEWTGSDAGEWTGSDVQ